MQGKIMKGIAGFYYVSVREHGTYECKAKGIFRKENRKPLVGDNVEVELLDEENKKGNMIDILPRKNSLIRPAVANIDQALVIFAVKKPDPVLLLLDRFLIMMENQHIPCIICFNKSDLATEEEINDLKNTYQHCGCSVLFISTKTRQGILEIEQVLAGKTTTVAGPSGVGKSSLINQLQSGVTMETGEISRKIERGKQTTRHTELIPICQDTFILDTPGFSSLAVLEIEKEELSSYYPEFENVDGTCRFGGCMHIHEPDCAVKEALALKQISPKRYENYQTLFRELNEKKKY